MTSLRSLLGTALSTVFGRRNLLTKTVQTPYVRYRIMIGVRALDV